MTLEQIARDAVQVQDACNLAGVLHAWAEMSSTLKRDFNLDEAGFRQHPVTILMFDKVRAMIEAGGLVTFHSFHEAFRWCQDTASKGRTLPS